MSAKKNIPTRGKSRILTQEEIEEEFLNADLIEGGCFEENLNTQEKMELLHAINVSKGSTSPSDLHVNRQSAKKHTLAKKQSVMAPRSSRRQHDGGHSLQISSSRIVPCVSNSELPPTEPISKDIELSSEASVAMPRLTQGQGDAHFKVDSPILTCDSDIDSDLESTLKPELYFKSVFVKLNKVHDISEDFGLSVMIPVQGKELKMRTMVLSPEVLRYKSLNQKEIFEELIERHDAWLSQQKELIRQQQGQKTSDCISRAKQQRSWRKLDNTYLDSCYSSNKRLAIPALQPQQVTELPGTSQMTFPDEKKVQCPICQLNFYQSKVEEHAAECGIFPYKMEISNESPTHLNESTSSVGGADHIEDDEIPVFSSLGKNQKREKESFEENLNSQEKMVHAINVSKGCESPSALHSKSAEIRSYSKKPPARQRKRQYRGNRLHKSATHNVPGLLTVCNSELDPAPESISNDSESSSEASVIIPRQTQIQGDALFKMISQSVKCEPDSDSESQLKLNPDLYLKSPVTVLQKVEEQHEEFCLPAMMHGQGEPLKMRKMVMSSEALRFASLNNKERFEELIAQHDAWLIRAKKITPHQLQGLIDDTDTPSQKTSDVITIQRTSDITLQKSSECSPGIKQRTSWRKFDLDLESGHCIGKRLSTPYSQRATPAKKVAESPGTSQSTISDEKKVQCPICQLNFYQSKVEEHAAECDIFPSEMVTCNETLVRRSECNRDYSRSVVKAAQIEDDDDVDKDDGEDEFEIFSTKNQKRRTSDHHYYYPNPSSNRPLPPSSNIMLLRGDHVH